MLFSLAKDRAVERSALEYRRSVREKRTTLSYSLDTVSKPLAKAFGELLRKKGDCKSARGNLVSFGDKLIK